MSAMQAGTTDRDKRDRAGTNGTEQSASSGTNGTHPLRGVPCPVRLSRVPLSHLEDQLTALASRVVRFCPHHRAPERFHEEKSEIVHESPRFAGDGRG